MLAASHTRSKERRCKVAAESPRAHPDCFRETSSNHSHAKQRLRPNYGEAFMDGLVGLPIPLGSGGLHKDLVRALYPEGSEDARVPRQGAAVQNDVLTTVVPDRSRPAVLPDDARVRLEPVEHARAL